MSSTRPPQNLIGCLARPLTAPLILLLAGLLRFYQLSGQSLWADEGNSVALARRGFVEIARRTAFDIHPPLYYWLLKIWIFIFGDGEIGLRSLSVVLGIGLVYLIGVLGTRFFGPRAGLMAAFIAALSPLQVYYAQEARMYMLLALLSALTVLAASLVWQNYSTGRQSKSLAGPIYALTAGAGLYTHYAYPLILLAVNLTALILFWQSRRSKYQLAISNYQSPISNLQSPISNLQSPISNLQNWLLLHLIPLLLYLPWLPIAWRQITTWPSERQAGSLLTILEQISTTLLFGLSWPFDLKPAAAMVLGLILLITLGLGLNQDWPIRPAHITNPAADRGRQVTAATPPASRLPFYARGAEPFRLILLWLWFLLPVSLTAIIFSPAFLKFLLVATPPLALLIALAIEGLALRLHRLWSSGLAGRSEQGPGQARSGRAGWPGYLVGGALLAALSGASAVSLYHYYTDPAYARDNYRGIANFIKAIGGPQDAVILNAEGQQDVFNYYYEPGPASLAPVYPLPRQRPLDEAATLNELQQLAARAHKIYAVYWAAQQADPAGLIEGWLNRHLTKATDRWYGNVRLVSYANPAASAGLEPAPVNYRLGRDIRLTGYALSASQITPGDILQVKLVWKTEAPLPEDFTVFVQVLDQANHVVGQRDAPPLTATSAWPVAEPVGDRQGIFIEPGTPPGKHRLIVGMYDSLTGQRLPVTSDHQTNKVEGSDFIELADVEIIHPATPLPPAAFNIQVPLNQPMVDVVLLGYDLYKAGHSSSPDTPLHPGDPLHLVAYWSPRWPVRRLKDQLFIQVITNSGRSSPLFVTRLPSGTDYPIKEWQPGEIIRAQYDLFLTNVEPGVYRLALTLAGSEISRQQVVAVTKPFRVD